MDTVTKQFFELMVVKLLCISKNIKTLTSYAQTVTFIAADDTKTTLTAPSKDDDDILKTALEYLRK